MKRTKETVVVVAVVGLIGLGASGRARAAGMGDVHAAERAAEKAADKADKPAPETPDKATPEKIMEKTGHSREQVERDVRDYMKDITRDVLERSRDRNIERVRESRERSLTREKPDLRYREPMQVPRPVSKAPGLIDRIPGKHGAFLRGVRERVNTNGFPQGFGGVERPRSATCAWSGFQRHGRSCR